MSTTTEVFATVYAFWSGGVLFGIIASTLALVWKQKP